MESGDMNNKIMVMLSLKMKSHNTCRWSSCRSCDVYPHQNNINRTYRKIPIISPELIFFQRAFLLGLVSGELIFIGANYWKEFAFPNGLGLTIKTA